MDDALALMDDEFLRARNRHGSIEKRFPSLIRRQDPGNLFIARTQRGIASVLVTHDTQIDAFRVVRQVGMVSTKPEYRKRGIASALIQFAQSSMARDGVRFALLWTNAHPFYARLGWWISDLSCVTSVQGCRQIESRTSYEIDIARVRQADAIRHEWKRDALPRSNETWSTVPPHADEVELILDDYGYALIGKKNGTGYLYEMCGPQHSWPILWKRLRSRYRYIIANGQSGSAWVRWMSRENDAVWRHNPLAMHLAPATIARSGSASMPHFSVIDRI